MTIATLSDYFSQLEQTSSRLDMTEILSKLFKDLDDSEIAPVVYISLGRLRPKFDRLEFNLAEKMVFRAIAEAFGVEEKEVKREYKAMGDIGETAEKFKEQTTINNKQNISIAKVFELLEQLARDSGEGSQERKVSALAELLKELDPLSTKYIARLVVGKLRLGFSDMTILDALSWMEVGDKSVKKILEQAYQYRPDVGHIATLVKQVGSDHVAEKVKVELGVPIVPALAQRLKTADDMVKKMGKVAVEPKFDGTRVQIHYRRFEKNKNEKLKIQNGGASGGFESDDHWTVRTFTRNLDESSFMFPELLEIGEYVDADELILDSEGIAYDPKTGELRPFQDTIQRKRKHGIEEAAKEIPLKFFIFDVMYKDGKSLVHKPWHERREILEKVLTSKNKTSKRKFPLVEASKVIVTEDPDQVREYHSKQLSDGLEGALVKKHDGVYEPGRRGYSWVKFKESEDSQAKLSDTVDAVVMGLYAGKGKRSQFGVGAFLIGVRADQKIKNSKLKIQNDGASGGFEEGMFYTISKVGTGLSDDQWRELKTRSEKLESKEQPKEYEVHKDLVPDVWLAPGLVVEVAADEITKSPNHSAGSALRFPRLIRFRDDKDSLQTTTLVELQKIKTN